MRENILDMIVAEKKREVTFRKEKTPVGILESAKLFSQPCLSFSGALTDPGKSGIIAEFKRKSPSLGWINRDADVVEVTRGYAENGASSISVLTDESFFGGSLDDLGKALGNGVPVLRKDFIIDEYQLIEAKSAGADIILLIAACLTPQDVKRLAGFARSLGLNVLLELHHESELDHVCEETDVVGINNRNLKTFEVDVENSIRLAEKLNGRLCIAESGLRDVATIRLLKQHGFSGFLMGEYFMKQQDPALALKRFIDAIKN